MNSTREKLKTVLICLLLIGMVYLTYSVWFFDSPFGKIRIENLLDVSGENYVSDGAGADVAEFGIRPLSIAIRQDGANRAILYNTAACDEAYKKLRPWLSAAIRRGKEMKQTGEIEWEDVLSRDGVLLDYHGNIPVEALRLWLGEESGADATCGRYFFFSTEHRNVSIYVKNADTGRVYRIETSASADNLKEVASGINAESAEYAFLCEGDEFSSVYPEMLVPLKQTKPTVISPYNIYTAFEAETIASCLENFRLRDVALSSYSEKDGTRVYIADMVTMKISPSGIVSYSDLRDEADETLGLKINSETENPTFAEKCEAARSAVAGMAKKIAGAGEIYMIYAARNGSNAEFVFGRHINGIPVDMRETLYFAKVVIKEKNVGDVRLNLTGYEKSAQTTDILPSRLAIAAMKGRGDICDLNLRYKDGGEVAVSPAWFIGSIKKGEK